MKKILFKVIIVMSIIALTACGSGASGDVSESSDKVYTLDFNIPYPDNSETTKPAYYAYHWLKDEIEKRSDGRLKVDLYFNGQLAQAPELLDALASGTVDMGYVTASYYGDLVPEGFITSFAYCADDQQEAYDLWYNTEIGEIFNKAFTDYGATPLMNTYFTHGGWLLNKPVHSVEDMDGLLIAAVGGLFNTWYDEMGVTGVDIPHSDWYDALSRGVVDGVSTGFQVLKNWNLHEVIDYIVLPPFQNAVMGNTFISNKTLEELPEDLQDIIFEVSKEAELHALEASKEFTNDIVKQIEEFEAAGSIEVITLTKEQEEKFIESVQPMFDKFASLSEGNARMIEIIRENNK